MTYIELHKKLLDLSWENTEGGEDDTTYTIQVNEVEFDEIISWIFDKGFEGLYTGYSFESKLPCGIKFRILCESCY